MSTAMGALPSNVLRTEDPTLDTITFEEVYSTLQADPRVQIYDYRSPYVLTLPHASVPGSDIYLVPRMATRAVSDLQEILDTLLPDVVRSFRPTSIDRVPYGFDPEVAGFQVGRVILYDRGGQEDVTIIRKVQLGERFRHFPGYQKGRTITDCRVVELPMPICVSLYPDPQLARVLLNTRSPLTMSSDMFNQYFTPTSPGPTMRQ
jgi:hypothetical protein